MPVIWETLEPKTLEERYRHLVQALKWGIRRLFEPAGWRGGSLVEIGRTLNEALERCGEEPQQ